MSHEYVPGDDQYGCAAKLGSTEVRCGAGKNQHFESTDPGAERCPECRQRADRNHKMDCSRRSVLK